MISFLVPSEECDFNLNSVGRGGVTFRSEVSNGTTRMTSRDLRSGQTTLAPRHTRQVSPNNNSYHLVSSTSGVLDNRPAGRLSGTRSSCPARPPLTLTRDLPMMDDSSSDDTTTGSLAPLRVDEVSDEIMTPGDRPSASPVCPEGRLLPPSAPTSARSGKLKRVSFGSSKGSMVETLIYDCEPTTPAEEEREFLWPAAGRHSGCFTAPSPAAAAAPTPSYTAAAVTRPGSAARSVAAVRPVTVSRCPASLPRPEDTTPKKVTSRVRVTYYESKRPLSVSASSSEGSDICERRATVGRPPPTVSAAAAAVTARAAQMPTTYIVSSVDSGWENPFRPGGELSKEADQIVRAIQSGRPLDSSVDSVDGPDDPALAPAGNGHASPPAANGQPGQLGSLPVGESVPAPVRAATQTAAAPRPAADSPPPPGTTVLAAAQPAGTVEVRRSVAAAPEGAAQVERVALKKKPRARCCVVQ